MRVCVTVSYWSPQIYAEGSDEVPQDYEAAMERFQKAKDMVGCSADHVMSCDLPGRVMLMDTVEWECSTSMEWEWNRYEPHILCGPTERRLYMCLQPKFFQGWGARSSKSPS